jgi:hypothetical protein
MIGGAARDMHFIPNALPANACLSGTGVGRPPTVGVVRDRTARDVNA